MRGVIKKKDMRGIKKLHLIAIFVMVLLSLGFRPKFDLRVSMSPKEPRTENQRTHTTVTGECSPLLLSTNPLIRPIWVPSFPGSGSELFRELVQGTTGGVGADYYKTKQCTITNEQRAIVSCKTHWPVRVKAPYGRVDPKRLKDSFRDRFIFLIRNPRNAIPSYMNYKWEATTRRRDHVKQAPESIWRKKRDLYHTNQMRKWEESVSWWHMQGQYEPALYVQYEKLTDNATGPELLRSVVNELQQGLPDSVDLPIEDIPCIWHKIVIGGKMKRKKRTYIPGYTVEQKQQLLEMLDRMILKFSDDSNTHGAPSSATVTLLGILHDYREDIAINTPLDEVRFNVSSDSRT